MKLSKADWIAALDRSVAMRNAPAPVKPKGESRKSIKKRRRARLEDDPWRPTPTKYENMLARMLREGGLKVIQQHKVVTGGKRRFLDIYLPEPGMGVEVNGGYHRGKGRAKKDRRREETILKWGKNVRLVWTLWNSEVFEDSRAVRELIAYAHGISKNWFPTP